MTSADFRAWLDHMRERHNRTHGQCAEALGCAPNSITKWKRRDPPLYIGLACAALAKGMRPWTQPLTVRAFDPDGLTTTPD